MTVLQDLDGRNRGWAQMNTDKSICVNLRSSAVSFLLVIVLAAGCVRPTLRDVKLAALAAKETAETAYITIRVQYLLGRVDAATMQRARELYVSWALAQEALLSAIASAETGVASGSGQDIASLRRRVEVFAAELGRLADEAKTEGPATRPSGGKR